MAATKPLHFVVLGGGISGLTAAHSLSKYAPRGSKITLLEAAKNCGGWLQSTRGDNGAVFEHGPRGIRPFGKNGAAVLNLVSDIGLQNEVVPSLQSSKAGRQRYVYRNSKLMDVPTSVAKLLFSKGPLSHRFYRLFAKDLSTGRKATDDDETVYSFFLRRFGKEAAEYLGDPFCRGIFAGDCRQLSMNACFPMLINMEKQYRSIILAALLAKDDNLDLSNQSDLVKRSIAEKWRTWTLKNGLQQFGRSLEGHLRQDGVDIQVNTPCTSMQSNDGMIELSTSQGNIFAHHVISSLPAYALDSILNGFSEDLVSCLQGIPFASCGVVNLEYSGHHLVKDGFGFLVPSSEDLNVLGIIFDTCTFPELGPKDKEATQLTVMMGGSRYKEMYGEPRSTDKIILEGVAIEAVRQSLDITAEPEKTIVNVMENCIPQYKLGHVGRVANARKSIASLGIPLTLAGASYDGVSVPDVVYKTQEHVRHLLKGF